MSDPETTRPLTDEDWVYWQKRVSDEHDQQSAKIDQLRVAAVRAVMPLEVLRMSGWQTKFTPEVQQAIDEGIAAVRDAIS